MKKSEVCEWSFDSKEMEVNEINQLVDKIQIHALSNYVVLNGFKRPQKPLMEYAPN